MAEINIKPFTDRLLVLLVIFMVLAALATPPGFQKHLTRPTANHERVPWQNQEIKVKVTRTNRIYIDGKMVPFANLYQAMAPTIGYHELHRAQGHTKHISLLEDNDASYNTIIRILDAARQAGDEDVGFVSQE